MAVYQWIPVVFAASLLVATPTVQTAASGNPIPEEYKSSGFFLGCQAWTWNHFTVFEAIQKTAEAGGKIIEFFPGQKLSADEPDVTWDHNASPATIDKVKAQLVKYHIKAVNY